MFLSFLKKILNYIQCDECNGVGKIGEKELEDFFKFYEDIEPYKRPYPQTYCSFCMGTGYSSPQIVRKKYNI